MEANDGASLLPVEILVSTYGSYKDGCRDKWFCNPTYASTYSLSNPGPVLILLARVHQAAGMAEAMDGRDASGLRAGRRREERKDEILQWWRDYRAKPCSGSRSLEVRDKVDGSNRYGVIPWEVPLRDQGVTPVGELEEPEAVHSGYAFISRPTRRSRRRRSGRNRQG